MSNPLKFPMCLGHGQKMCILFAYIPNVILFQVETFFRRPYIESTPYVRNSSHSFMSTVSKLYRCHCLKMGICFGYYPQIIFFPFSQVALCRFLRIYYYPSDHI